MPLYHIYGLIANMIGLFAAGAHIIFQPSLRGPDIIQTLKENDITVFPAVPQLWELFFDGIVNKVKNQSAAKYKIFMFFVKAAPVLRKIGLKKVVKKIFTPIYDTLGHNMRYLISAGAPLKKEYFRYYENIGYKMLNAYGLTETTGPIGCTKLSDTKPISVGLPLEGNFAKLKNKNSEGIGEIWAKGMSVMPGYYKNDQANAEAFDEEGWFNTGDLGYIDKTGCIYITGRSKNVIVLDSGKNVYPEEIEAFYKNSTKIEELAIFGRKINGVEHIYAVIVPTNKTKNSYTEIKQELEQMGKGLPSYKVIGAFAISFDPLSRTSKKSLKIRDIVKDLDDGKFQTEESSDQISQKELTGDTPEEEIIITALKNKLNKKTLYATQTFHDLDLDSLKVITLISHLEEELGIAIDTDKFINLDSLKDGINYLKTCEKRTDKNIDDEILKSDITTKINTFYNPVIELMLFIAKIITKLLWRVKVINKENIQLDNNIIIANHQSYLDIIWILTNIPYKLRKNILMIGKKEVAYFKYLFPGTHIVFVDRGGNVIPALKAGADILRQGKSLLLFPEGTRTPDGKLQEFKTGAAYLAKNLEKDILPITVNGAYKIYPRNKLFPKLITKDRGEIVIGKKVAVNNTESIDQINKKLEEAIKANIKN